MTMMKSSKTFTGRSKTWHNFAEKVKTDFLDKIKLSTSVNVVTFHWSLILLTAVNVINSEHRSCSLDDDCRFLFDLHEAYTSLYFGYSRKPFSFLTIFQIDGFRGFCARNISEKTLDLSHSPFWNASFYSRSELRLGHTFCHHLLIQYDLFILVIDDVCLKKERSIEYLGVFIDSHLSWKPQIEYISKKTEEESRNTTN